MLRVFLPYIFRVGCHLGFDVPTARCDTYPGQVSLVFHREMNEIDVIISSLYFDLGIPRILLEYQSTL